MATGRRIKDGHTIEITASGAAIAAGELVVVGTIACVSIYDLADGESGPAQVTGEFLLESEAAAWNQGDAIYVTGAGVVTKTVGSNTLIGHAARAKALNETDGYVLLNL